MLGHIELAGMVTIALSPFLHVLWRLPPLDNNWQLRTTLSWTFLYASALHQSAGVALGRFGDSEIVC